MTPDPAHVLLVDDYPDALEVWTLFLQTSGYDVAAAADGSTALRAALARTPHVVVLDLQLPDLSGLEVARRLRAAPATASIPLIALTGRALPADVAEARAAGFDDVLVKPCEPSDLLAAIRRALDRVVES
ncbi:MAG: response regulator [Vicinamibacterales bacterium]